MIIISYQKQIIIIIIDLGGKISYYYIPNILLTYDAVCVWLLIGQSQSVSVIVVGK